MVSAEEEKEKEKEADALQVEELPKVKDEKEAFVIGGGMIYKQFYPMAGKLYLTLVHKDFDADVYFPSIDYKEWDVESREDFHDEKNGFDYSLSFFCWVHLDGHVQRKR